MTDPFLSNLDNQTVLSRARCEQIAIQTLEDKMNGYIYANRLTDMKTQDEVAGYKMALDLCNVAHIQEAQRRNLL